MTLKNIFEPESIAVIGASNDLKKWGGSILFNLLEGGYEFDIFPVNQKESMIQDRACYKSVLDIPGNVDLAVIVVHTTSFISVLKECGEKGIKGILAITAGFREIGNKELEDEVISIVKQYGMRLLGPNSLGFLNISKNINLSVIQQTPKFGNISFICQSGTMGIAVVENAILNNVGLNKIISTGNKANIDDIDLLEYLDQDDDTKVIIIYAESISRGKDFIRVAKNIKKPIIVLKAGRSKSGAKAAFSHTGSMAGSNDVYTSAFKQAGVIRIDEMEEIFDAAIVFTQNLPKGNRIGVISNGGGAGILTSDLCEKFGIEVPDIEQNTKDIIKKALKQYGSAKNPVDTAADCSYDAYFTSVNSMLNDKNIDALIVIYVHTAVADSIAPANAIVDVVKGAIGFDHHLNVPVIACFFGGPGYERGVKILEKNGIPNYITPERAVRALDYLLQHKKCLDKKL